VDGGAAVNELDAWLHDEASGITFERPAGLKPVPALSSAAGLAQFEDGERALVLSTYERHGIAEGASALKGLAATVLKARRARGMAEVLASEGGAQRWRLEFVSTGDDASKVVVVAARTGSESATVVEISYPMAYEDDLQAIVERISSSVVART
jgi:hypothetical protein